MNSLSEMAWRWITRPEYLLIEDVTLLVLLALAYLLSGWISLPWEFASSRLGKLARRPVASLIIPALAVVMIRVSLLPLFPVPDAQVHDEFGYLLGADTFAKGRLTNPTHPEWVHFESVHIFQQPTYMMQYPPGQSIVMAAGQVLWHPWLGVLLSGAFMSTSLCWMLRGWMSPEWALLGAVLGSLRWCLFTYWMDGYWGGSVALIGGCLVLGALGRLWRGDPERRCVIMMAVGLGVLANTRPFEGLMLAVGLAAVLLARYRLRTFRLCLPMFTVLLPVCVWMLYYNFRVTGDPLTMPYKVAKQIYGMARPFWFLTPGPSPGYRHEDLRLYFEYELSTQPLQFQQIMTSIILHFGMLWRFYFGPALTLALLMAPWIVFQKRLRPLVWITVVMVVGLSLETWMFPHYMAPFGGLAMLFVLVCLEQWNIRFPFVTRAIVLTCLLMGTVPVIGTLAGMQRPPEFSSWWATQWQWERPSIEKELRALPGKDLVLIKYGPSLALQQQWIYNDADIDSAEIVWARDLGDSGNQSLLAHFKGRRIWTVDFRISPAKLLAK